MLKLSRYEKKYTFVTLQKLWYLATMSSAGFHDDSGEHGCNLSDAKRCYASEPTFWAGLWWCRKGQTHPKQSKSFWWMWMKFNLRIYFGQMPKRDHFFKDIQSPRFFNRGFEFGDLYLLIPWPCHHCLDLTIGMHAAGGLHCAHWTPSSWCCA